MMLLPFYKKIMRTKFVSNLTGIGIFLSLLSCGTARHSGRSGSSLPGTWQATPIVIDGDSKDWPSPYPNYDAKSMVAYATSNDAHNLYITMETGDISTQVKILKQGMTVSIDTNGKKDPQFNINYPLLNDNEPVDLAKQEMQSRSSAAGRLAEQKIKRLLQDANQFSLDGFAGCNGGFMAAQTAPCGIKVSARIDEYKNLVYEVVIPFKAIYNKEVISAIDAGKPVSVCFTVKGFKGAAKKNTDNNNTNTGMNNGMGVAGANSTAPGRGSSGSSAQDPLQHFYESTKTWKHFGILFQN
jgi:hypothetical protein